MEEEIDYKEVASKILSDAIDAIRMMGMDVVSVERGDRIIVDEHNLVVFNDKDWDS